MSICEHAEAYQHLMYCNKFGKCADKSKSTIPYIDANGCGGRKFQCNRYPEYLVKQCRWTGTKTIMLRPTDTEGIEQLDLDDMRAGK